MNLAKFGTITGSDFLKGLVVAVLTTITASLYDIVQTGSLPTLAQLKAIGIIALSAGLSYLLKNLFTNSQDQLFKSEPKQTNTNPPPVNTESKVLPMLILFIGLLAFVQPRAEGLLANIASPVSAHDSAKWVLQVDVPASALAFRMGDGNPVIGAAVGMGIAYKRQVWVGNNYTTFSLILSPLFFPFTVSDKDVFPWKIGVGLFASALNGWVVGIGAHIGTIEGKQLNRGMILIGRDFESWSNIVKLNHADSLDLLRGRIQF
jgi:hypothetical protein